jgi:hypothetical protein
MKIAMLLMKSRSGDGNTPKKIVTTTENKTVIRVSIEGINTLVASSSGSEKNIKTITRM